MSGEVAIILAISFGYLLLSLVVGIVFGRKASTGDSQGFVAANRSFGIVLMYFITGATIFSSFAFLGMPGRAYERGASAFYIISYGAVAMVPLYFYGPRVARWGRRFGYLTQGDFVADRFGCSILPSFMAWVSLAAFVPYLVLQMEGAALLLSHMTDGFIPEWLGALLPYLVVLLYVLVGGVKGVGATNVLQGVFMLLIAWFLGLYIPYHLYGGVGEMFERIVDEHPGHMILPGPSDQSLSSYCSEVFVSILGFTMWPHLFMKIFTSKSDKTLRQTVVLYPSFLLFLVPILFLGFAGVLYREGLRADTILPVLVSELDLPLIVVGLFCAGGLAASMSSGDAIVHAASAVMIRDFGSRVVKDMSPRVEAVAMRFLVVLLGAVAYVLAIATDINLVRLLLIGYGGVVQFFPLIMAGCYFPRATRAGALSGLIAGTGVTIVGTFSLVPMPLDLEPGVVGLVLNAALLVVVSLLTRPPQDRMRFFGGPAS